MKFILKTKVVILATKYMKVILDDIFVFGTLLFQSKLTRENNENVLIIDNNK